MSHQNRPRLRWAAAAATISTHFLALVLVLAPALGTPVVASAPAGPAVGAVQAAQTLPGRLQDSEGRPIADWPIALHRVDSGGGLQLAADTTDAEGRFVFPLELTPDGLYFVATRYDGSLYVGTPFRAPGPPDAEYVVVVGAGGTVVPTGAGEPGFLPPAVMAPPPQGLPTAGIALLLFVATTFIVAVRAGGSGHGWRALVIELAELEEAFAGSGATASNEERERYRRRRGEIWERLKVAARVG